MGDSRHPLNIPITADPVIGNQKPHNMKKLLIFLAVIALTLSCEKENNPKSQITVLDKLVETAASTNDDGSYNLEMTMSGGGYTVKLSVPNPDMKLKAGSYEVKTGGCSVSFNSGYVERKVSGGTIDIASDNNAYTIDMTVISRNEEFRFKFHGQIEFKSFVGTVIRNRSVNSAQMKREMKYSIYLPKDYGTGESFPVLYLLHGYGDENNAWLDKGNLAKIAKDYESKGGKQMIVVCQTHSLHSILTDTREITRDTSLRSWFLQSKRNITSRQTSIQEQSQAFQWEDTERCIMVWASRTSSAAHMHAARL